MEKKSFFMKKRLFIISFFMVLSLTGCENVFNSERNPRDVTISQARNFRDGTYVRISGTIESSTFTKWYIFSDHTGSITVEIENEVWVRGGINSFNLVLPAQFEIIGEVEKERGQETVIEVERIRRFP